MHTAENILDVLVKEKVISNKTKSQIKTEIARQNDQYTIKLEDVIKSISKDQQINIEYTFLGKKIGCIYQGICADYCSSDKNYYVMSIEFNPNSFIINVVKHD